MAICTAARSRLRKWRQSGLGSAAWSWEAEFLSGEIEPTAWWLERAVFLLSLSWEHDRLVRRSFAAWLVPHMLQEVLRLDLIASFTSRGFHELSALDHEIAAAWREIEDYGDENWARCLAKAARCSPDRLQLPEQVVEQFGVDLALPHAFYRDMLFFAPNSLTDPQDRSAWLRAVRDGNGAAMVQSARRAQGSSIVCGPRSLGRRSAPISAA